MMIVMFFVNSVVNILCGVLTGMQILSLPVDLIGALATCVQYGQYVMGAGLFLAVLASAMFWIGLKATAGLLIFIWKLLPLT